MANRHIAYYVILLLSKKSENTSIHKNMSKFLNMITENNHMKDYVLCDSSYEILENIYRGSKQIGGFLRLEIERH